MLQLEEWVEESVDWVLGFHGNEKYPLRQWLAGNLGISEEEMLVVVIGL